MPKSAPFNVLVVEPSELLRRTVALTVRGLGTAEVTEAATYPTARQVCGRRRFDGAVIAVESLQRDPCKGLALIQQIRGSECASSATIPIAVLVDACDTELLHVLRSCAISRILIKPFRVRDVIETIDGMRARAAAS